MSYTPSRICKNLFQCKASILTIRIIDRLMDEQEEYTLLLNKVIQDYMLNTFKYTTDQRAFNDYFAKFYDILDQKTQMLQDFWNEEWKTNATIEYDQKMDPQKNEMVKCNPHKKVTMRYSLIYYVDIMTHIMLLIDEKILLNNKVLIEKIKNILLGLLKGFCNINYSEMKEKMHPIYFHNLFYVANKNLTLVSRLISKCKSNKHPQARDPGDLTRHLPGVMQMLTQFIEENMGDGKNLVSLILDLLTISDNSEPKHKFDCYTNIRSFMQLYPEWIMSQVSVILNDSYFTKERSHWSISDVNNVLYFWIYSQKAMMKQSRGKEAQYMIMNQKKEVQYMFIDNIIGIIFDRRAFPNFVVNALHHLKVMIEYISQELSNKLEKFEANLMLKILQKMVIQMKIVRNNHRNINEFLEKNEGKEISERNKVFDQMLFNKMPRYENFTNEDEFQAAIDKYLMNDEIDLDSAFLCTASQSKASYVSPLLEDEEGLVVNSVAIHPCSQKLSLSLDENVLVRINHLNEISAKLTTIIMFNKLKQGDSIFKRNMSSNMKIFYQTLDHTELYLIKKMYKYNLEIFYQLTINPGLTNFKQMTDPLKFDTEFIERKFEDGLYRLDSRHLYFMIEGNIKIIFKILKNLVKLGSDSYPQYFQQFFDIFTGTNTQIPGKNNGLYMYTIFCEILIRNLMFLLDNLPENVDKSHFLYDEELNIHVFMLKILKYIFRTIRYRENSNHDFALGLITKLKTHIFKLILVVIKLSSQQIYPIDYLFLLKIIFKTIVRCEQFSTYFTQEITKKGIRILEFFLALFNSGIDELKILSAELTLFIPLEIKHFLVKYPDYAKDLIPMITFSLTLQESFIRLRAIQTLDHIINSSSMLKQEVLHLLKPHAKPLFKNLNSLMVQLKKKSFFFKMSSNMEPTIFPASMKILGKLSAFIRELDISITFQMNDDYEVEIIEEFDPPVEMISEEETAELFSIDVENVDGMSYKFSTTQTLIAIFKTIKKLSKKPLLYYYYSISPNLLFVSTLKHRLGIQRIYEYLRHIFDALILTSNKDIQDWCEAFPISDRDMQQEGLWSRAMCISRKGSYSPFMLQRIFSKLLEVLNFLHPFKSEDSKNFEFERLKDALFTLIKKSFDEDFPYIKNNLIAILCTTLSSMRHQITLSRESPEDKNYATCTLIVDKFLDYSKLKDPQVYESFVSDILFEELIKNLYCSDYKISIGSIYYFKSILARKLMKQVMFNKTTEIIEGVIVFLNKLPSKFHFEIQNSSIELCKQLTIAFLNHYHECKDFVDRVALMIKRLTQLIYVNDQTQQKLLIQIFNLIINQREIDEKALYSIFFCEEWSSERELTLGDILSSDKYKESGSPFYMVISYVFSTLENYRSLIENKKNITGGFKFFNNEQCDRLSAMIIVLTHILKLKIPLRLFTKDKEAFDPHIQQILDNLLLLIKENEDFNEKVMDHRGSSIKVRPTNQHPILLKHGDQMNEASSHQRQPQGHSYQVNNDVYYQDIEHNIHVDDHDFTISSWSTLVETIVHFFARFLMNKSAHEVVKETQNRFRAEGRDGSENKVLEIRNSIIVKMFDLLSRVENKIRRSADDGFKYLLNLEEQVKDIMFEDKLINCFRPLLTCLQSQDLQSINQTTLYNFRKLFKLFHTCFKKARLYEKLKEYIDNFSNELSTGNTKFGYAYFQLINSIFVLFTKMMNKDESNTILKIGIHIESKLQEKNIYNFSLKPVLRKVINTQSGTKMIKFIKDFLDNDDIFNFILETLKHPESHPFRERLSREDLSLTIRNEIDENRGEAGRIEAEKKVYRWSLFIRILRRKIPNWLVLDKGLIEIYKQKFDNMVENYQLGQDLARIGNTPLKDDFISVLKIIVQYCRYEKTNIKLVYSLLKVVGMKINNDIEFIYDFFKYEISSKYLLSSQAEIVMHFLNLIDSEGIKQEGETLRLANRLIVLPILRDAFSQKNDEKILTIEVVNNLRAKIKFLYENSEEPAWVLIEISLLLDYIVAKTNFTNNHEGVQELLKDVLIFAWKNVGSPRENNKLLKNMSKLLVSRLISRFEKLYDNLSYINQLFKSVVLDLGDIVDDETKNIWIKICNILLPEIKKFNYDFEANKAKSSQYWIQDFLCGIEGMNIINPKEFPSLYNRYWNVLIINRDLVEPHKKLLLDGNKFYRMVNTFVNSDKQPNISLDILLLFIEWYIKDMKTAKDKNNGVVPDKFFGVNPQQEMFFVNILLELVKRDENTCGNFINRAYYLLRKYLLVFRKSCYSPDTLVKLLKTNQGDPRESEESLYNYTRLRLNMVIMNISLCFLYHQMSKEAKEKLISKIYNYVFSELLQKDSKNYTKFPYLIPLSYEIIKRILFIDEPAQRAEHITDITQRATNSLDTIVKSYREKTGGVSQGNVLSLWVAILQLKLIYEIRPELLVSLIGPITELIKIFVEYMIKKSGREENQTDVSFDENKDVVDSFFYCEDINPYTENVSPRLYYKGYSIILLRMLVINFNSLLSNWKERSIIPIFQNVLQKISFADYDLKIEALMLIKCIVLPHLVISKVYKRIAEKILAIKMPNSDFKPKIFFSLEPQSFLSSKEFDNKGYSQFAQIYWDILLDVIDCYPNCEIISINIRKICLISNTIICLEQKDRLFNKLRIYGDDYKHFLLVNNVFLNSHYNQNTKQTDIVKKINLFNGAELIERGQVSSPVSNLIQNARDVVLATEADEVPEKIQVGEPESIEEELSLRAINYKLSLKNSSSITFFNSYRDVIDMDFFEDSRNTYVFWNSYIQQSWAQGTTEQRERMWLHLNNILNFKGASSNDLLFTMLSMKELSYPFMTTEQINITTQKIDGCMPSIYFLEAVLDQVKAKPCSVEGDALFYALIENLDDLNESDIKYGMMKAFVHDDLKAREMVTKVQMRKWAAAESICEDVISEMNVIDNKSVSLHGHIGKYIAEECWIEVMKNLNEWQKLYDMAISTERQDLLVESAYYMHKPQMMDRLSGTSLDGDNPLTYIYYMSIRLIDPQCKDEIIAKEVTKKLKELLYITLINKCYILPNVFSEKHKALLAISNYGLEFEEGWDLIQYTRKHGEAKEMPKIKDEILYLNLVNPI